LGISNFNDSVLWHWKGSALQPIVRENDLLPTSGQPVAFDRGFAYAADNGVLVLATLKGAGVDAQNDMGLWFKSNTGDWTPLIREGASVSSLPSGVVIGTIPSEPQMDRSGRFAQRVWLAGPGITDSNSDALVSNISGTPEIIFRAGQTFPGIGTINNVDTVEPDMNSLGQIGVSVTYGPTDGFTQSAIAFRRELNGENAILLRTGDSLVPELPNVKIVGLNGPEIDAQGRRTIIARAGDVIEVAPGDFRTIMGSGSWGANAPGNVNALNDLGQFAFRAEFTDGSQAILVSPPVNVPEPAAAVILATTLFGAAILRWRPYAKISFTTRAASTPVSFESSP
jgi:hypothetical protein